MQNKSITGKLPRKVIILSTGDPAGVGPELAIKCLEHLTSKKRYLIVPVGQEETLAQAARLTGSSIILKAVEDVGEAASTASPGIPFIPVKGLTHGFEKCAPSRDAGLISLAILRKAVELCIEDPRHYALVTCPINKLSISYTGVEGTGHTELLRQWTGAGEVETVFCLRMLKVFFLSRHVSLAQALKAIKRENIEKAIVRIHHHMQSLGHIDPRIGVPGLNPHCGERGLFGIEEEQEIRPAIEKMRGDGFAVFGPIGADSIFHMGLKGEFDAILSLYHDQGHIALKTGDFFGTVTMTLGLPILRTSVDHGTGYEIAWKGIAEERSLVKAVKLAAALLRAKEKSPAALSGKLS